MVAPLLAAGLQFAAGALGAIDGGHAGRKAQTQAFRLNLETNQQAADLQAMLSLVQNTATDRVNDRIHEFNVGELDRWKDSGKTTGTTTTGSVNLAQLVADSEKAGFNPLTVLRAGGAAGYFSQSSESFGYTPQFQSFIGPSGIPQGPQPGALQAVAPPTTDWGGVMASALGAYSTFSKQPMEKAIAQAQLRNLDADTAASKYRMAVPTYTASGTVRTSGGGGGSSVSSALAQAAAGKLGSYIAPTAGKITVTNPLPYGIGDVNPNIADAQQAEDRWGELVGWVYGVGALAADGGHTLRSISDKQGVTTPGVNYLTKSAEAIKKAAETAARLNWADTAPMGW